MKTSVASSSDLGILKSCNPCVKMGVGVREGSNCRKRCNSPAGSKIALSCWPSVVLGSVRVKPYTNSAEEALKSALGIVQRLNKTQLSWLIKSMLGSLALKATLNVWWNLATMPFACRW